MYFVVIIIRFWFCQRKDSINRNDRNATTCYTLLLFFDSFILVVTSSSYFQMKTMISRGSETASYVKLKWCRWDEKMRSNGKRCDTHTSHNQTGKESESRCNYITGGVICVETSFWQEADSIWNKRDAFQSIDSELMVWVMFDLRKEREGREEEEKKEDEEKRRNETVQEGFLLCVYWRRSKWRSREGEKKKKIRVLTTVTLTDLKILERTLMRKRPLFREGRLSSRHKGDIGEKEDDSRSRDFTLCLLMHVIPVCELHSFHHDNWLDSFIFVISYLLIWLICCKDDCRKRGDEEGETYEVILSSASSK